MMKRRISKPLQIGQVTVGGQAPVVVQSMTKTDTRDVRATVRQIKRLEAAGCQIVRLAVPDSTAADALAQIKQAVNIPLVADIHFDHRLALAAIRAGADALRINPGNIGGPQKVARVAEAAMEKKIPVRIGVNAGSLPKDLGPDLPIADRMVQAAMREIELLEKQGFDLIKISLKAFDVPTTIEAYRKMANMVSYPLHLGITEAGLPPAGIIRSTAGLAPLLYEGIGDTVRVSLTASPIEEVKVAWEILKSLNIARKGPVIVSCPTCGRTEMDVARIARHIEGKMAGSGRAVKIAVMGCVVNGPGEAKDADIGVAGGKDRAVIFKQGKKLKVIGQEQIVEELLDELNRWPD